MTLAPPSPATWTAGQFPQASDFNSQLRDAFTFLINKTVFRAWQSTAQSIPNNTATTILSFQTVIEDTYSGWVSATNRYNVQETGNYQISGCYYSGTATSGSGKIIQAQVKASGAVVASSISPIPTFTAFGVPILWEGFLVAGVDYIQLNAYQNSGAAANTFTSGVNQASYMEILWVGS